MVNANNAMYKQRLNDNTKEALERGAFGCPWFWVCNSKGEEEPFFGSDRYVHFAVPDGSDPLSLTLCTALSLLQLADAAVFSMISIADGEGVPMRTTSER